MGRSVFILGLLFSQQVSGGALGHVAFLGWGDFSTWRHTQPVDGEGWCFASPTVKAPIAFDELVLSWNAPNLNEADLIRWVVEVWNDQDASDRFILGVWGPGAGNDSRTSVNGQNKNLGRVFTDTLVLTTPVTRLRVSAYGLGEGRLDEELTMVGVSLLNTTAGTLERVSKRAAWGVELAVPQRCQLDYPGGSVWCSPTSVSMLLSHWANSQRRPELVTSVPDLAAQVYDPGWSGTGNWSFNTAFAGSFPGVRSYVVRLADIVDLESFLDQGIPVAVSVSYNRLKGKPRQRGDGHFVVCTGFRANGDLIVNDPARQPEVRWTYNRDDFIAAWSHSKNTAYLVVPQTVSLPPDPGGRWTAALP